MTGQNRLNYNIRRSTITSFNSGTGVITLGGPDTGYLGIDSGIAEGQWFTFGVIKGDGSTRFTGAGLYSATSGSGGGPGVTIVNDDDDVSDPFTWIDSTCIIFSTVSAYDCNDTKVHFAPSAPSIGVVNQGKLWWDTRNHILYVLYWDGSQTRWIAANGFPGSYRVSGGNEFLDVSLRRKGGMIASTGNNWPGGSSCRAGDLLLLFTYRDGNNTAPTLVSGYTSITTTGGNTNSMRAQARIATADDETPGTATNATESHLHVFQGHRQKTTGGTVSDAIGAFASTNGTGTTVTLKGLTTTEGPGGPTNSLVVNMIGHRSTDCNFGNFNSDLSLITWGDDGTTDTSGGYMSSRSLDDFSDVTQNVGGTASGWASITVEIRPAQIDEKDINLPGTGGVWMGRQWDGEKLTTTGQQTITASCAAYMGEGGTSVQTMTGLCGIANRNAADEAIVFINEYNLGFDMYPLVASGDLWSIDGGTNTINGVKSRDPTRAYFQVDINKGLSGWFSVMASYSGAEWMYGTQDYGS